MNTFDRQPKTVAYVLRDEQLAVKREVIEAVAKLIGNPEVHWLIADSAPDLGFFDRPDHFRILRCLNRGDRLLVCLLDLGGYLADLNRACETFARLGITQYWVVPNEAMVFEPIVAHGLDVLPPPFRAKLDAYLKQINRYFQAQQHRRSVQRRRQEGQRVSMRPKLGEKFMARGGKTFVVKDRAFHLWVERLLEWRRQGTTIAECQRRLSRAGAQNPATGGVWSRWRVLRALKWAKQQAANAQSSVPA